MSRLLDEIDKVYHECMDNHMDGFYTFEKKKQLLLAKWKLEKYLPQCSTYAGEEEWIKENKCD